MPGRQFDAGLPNAKWAVDMTYVATSDGWLYLAGVIDLCSRGLVGWSMAGPMETSSASDARGMVVARRCPGAGPSHHGDSGGRYASGDHVHRQQKRGKQASTSGVGQCRGNAAMGGLLGHAQDRTGPPRAVRDARPGAGANV